jgi:hypothetical protein
LLVKLETHHILHFIRIRVKGTKEEGRKGRRKKRMKEQRNRESRKE